MRFDLNEEQEALRSAVKAALQDDASAAVRAVVDGDAGVDERLWNVVSRLDLFAIALPMKRGGAGAGILDLAVAAEVIGYEGVPIPFLEHAVAVLAIAYAGTAEQADRWLPALISGQRKATFAVLDDDESWDPDRWHTQPRSPINGHAGTVLGAASADVLVLGIAGGFAVIDTSDPGVVVKPVEVLDRTRPIAQVRLSEPAYDCLIGSPSAPARVRDAALVLLAADAAGGAARCLKVAVDYAKTREQFGVSIGHFQAVKHLISSMALEVEPARALYWYGAHAIDSGLEDASRAAAVAIAHLTEAYLFVARKAIEVHGGFGYTWECDLHVWLKRAILDHAIFGSPRVHRGRVADLARW